MSLPAIDTSWTLFLDRDGVINIENPYGYINTPEEFIFHEGVKEAIGIFSRVFGHIFVVTNQRGVGRGITKPGNLALIHQYLLEEVRRSGGRIDKIYICTDLEDSSPNRKPNPGMGLAAKLDYPAIDFSRSLVVGNNLSDMQFGRTLGCKTVFLPTTNPDVSPANPLVDAVFDSLFDLATSLSGGWGPLSGSH